MMNVSLIIVILMLQILQETHANHNVCRLRLRVVTMMDATVIAILTVFLLTVILQGLILAYQIVHPQALGIM